MTNIPSVKSFIKQHLAIQMYKNSYYLIAGTLIVSLFGFIALIIATRLFSTDEIGFGSAALSAIGLVSVLSEFGIGIALIRFLPGAGNNRKNLINTCFSLNGLLAIIIAGIYIAGLNYWSPALISVRQNIVILVSFVAFSIFMVLRNLVENAFLTLQITKYRVITDFSYATLRIILLVVFAIWLHDPNGFFFSGGLAVAISSLIAIYCFLPRVMTGFYAHPGINKRVVREIAKYSLNNYIARLLLFLPPLIMPLIVINLLGTDANAHFYVVLAISSMLQIIPSSVSDSLLAEISNNENTLRLNTIKSIRQMMILLVPAVLVTIIIAKYILLIFGKGYTDNSVILLCLFAVAVIPYGINYLFISVARANKNMGIATILITLATGLSLLFAFLLAIKMKLIGIGVGYVAGQTLVAIIGSILLFKKLIIKPDVNSVESLPSNIGNAK